MKILSTAISLAVSGALAAPALAAQMLIVPMGDQNQALVIDTASDRVVGHIDELPNVHGLAVTPDGRLLIAASLSESASGAVTAPPKPAGMAEGDHKAHHGSGEAAGQTGAVSFISLIDVETLGILRRIEVPGAVHHVATTPDGAFAILTHPGGDGVSVVDLRASRLLTTIATGKAPNYATASPDGARLFVSNAGDGRVSEIDPRRWRVRRSIPTGASPEHMVIAADGRRLYVANVSDGTVAEIDVEKGSVVRRFEVGGILHGLDLSDDGERLFVSARERGELVAIDLDSGTMQRLALAPEPYHATAVRGTGKLYVSSADSPTLWVLDQRRLARLAEIEVDGTAHQMAVLDR